MYRAELAASPTDRTPHSNSTTRVSPDCIASPDRQASPCLAMNAPAAHRLPHPLQGIDAHSRQKIGEDPVLIVSGPPRPKRKAEERELHVRPGCGTFAVLAVDHLRFLRMHRQPALRQPQCDRPHYFLRLLPAAAMNHRIVGITGKRTARVGALHPGIESVVHEQIHQDRRDHSALRRTAVPRQPFASRSLERGSEPSLDIQQYPAFLDVAADRFHQETVIDLIEGRLDVKLHHPVVSPTPLSGDGNRLFRRAPGPVPISPFAPRPLQTLQRYYRMIRPSPGIGILPHGFCHLSFPFSSRTKFSRSVPKPVSSSCRLYTGCRRDRKPGSPANDLYSLGWLNSFLPGLSWSFCTTPVLTALEN
jgi:hypothetical protein